MTNYASLAVEMMINGLFVVVVYIAKWVDHVDALKYGENREHLDLISTTLSQMHCRSAVVFPGPSRMRKNV